MERTKEYSVVNDTLKALKNQGLSERYFQKGHSFSSAARYDHFDNSPYSAYPGANYRRPIVIILAVFPAVNLFLLSGAFSSHAASGKSCSA